MICSNTNETCNTNKRLGFVWNIIKQSFLNSTIHGTQRIASNDNLFIRIVWILFFLASGALCIYMICLNIIGYFQFDTVSKIEKHHLITTEFPAVTICNTNPYTTEESFKFISDLFIDNHMLNPGDEKASKINLDSPDYLFYRYFVGTNALDPNRTDSFRRSLGQNISDMLLSCTYNFLPCSIEDFSWYFDIYYGNCFTFNSGKFANGSESPIKKSTKNGALNGLRIELYLYEPEDLSSLSLSTGARIVVHNQTRLPSLFEGMLIPIGQQTYIEVSRVFTSLLEQPYSNCVNNINSNHPSQLVKMILSTGYAYTQQDCFYACYQFYLIGRCGCFDFSSFLPIKTFTDHNVGPCLKYSQMICNTKAYVEFFSLDVKSICARDCPLECSSIDYTMYMSHSEYPSIAYASVLANNPIIKVKYDANSTKNITLDMLKRNVLELSVFYGDLGYDRYSESAKMNVVDLISGIGGTLGLFLGMSFLSLIEILDIILHICFYKPPKSTNKNSEIFSVKF